MWEAGSRRPGHGDQNFPVYLGTGCFENPIQFLAYVSVLDNLTSFEKPLDLVDDIPPPIIGAYFHMAIVAGRSFTCANSGIDHYAIGAGTTASG